MLQVQTFLVPSEQDKANEFLKTHRPAPNGGLSFNKDMVVIFYDDDPAAPLVEYLESVGNARFQQELAIHMLKRDIAGLNPVHNKGKYEELDNAIRNAQEAIDDQDAKAEYVKQRIEEKRARK